MKSSFLGKTLRRLVVLERFIPPRISLPIRARLQSALGVIEPEYALLPLFCQSDRDSIDIGANAGTYTYAMSKHSKDVFAFEPVEFLAKRLRRTGIENVHIHNVALSNVEGVDSLHVPLIAGQSIFTRATLVGVEGEYREQRVDVVTLDSFKLDNIGFIKIDVEGHEYGVLEGAVKTIAKSLPRVLIEIEDKRLGALDIGVIFNWFITRGYRGWFYSNSILGPISEFDVIKHQSREAEFFKEGDYINNFIFIHESDLLVLPKALNER